MRYIQHLLLNVVLLGFSSPMIYADYPDQGIDVAMFSYRNRFQEAVPLRTSDVALLRLGHTWTCEGDKAGRGESYPTRFSSPLTFSQEYEFLRIKEKGTWGSKNAFFATTGLFGFRVNKAFANAGLANMRYEYMGFRLSKRNNLLIEVFSSQSFSLPAVSANYKESIESPGHPAIEYYLCTSSDSNDAEIESISGFCAIDDDQTNTEEGGCLDFNSGIVWGMTPSNVRMTQPEAERLCEGLEDGGRIDWRLPTETELFSLGGKDPTRTSSHFNFDANGMYWARDMGNAPFGWAVNLANGSSHYILKDASDPKLPLGALQDQKAKDSVPGEAAGGAGYVCIRKPLDSDKDFVPDSSDLCPFSKKGATVEKVGDKKGCAAGEVPSSSRFSK